MMNVVRFLQMNGSLCGGKRQMRCLRFPAKRMITRSVRFGNHAFILEKKTMQILPMGNIERTSPGLCG